MVWGRKPLTTLIYNGPDSTSKYPSYIKKIRPEKPMNLTLKELDELLSILQETPRTTKESTELVKRLEDYRLRMTTI